MRTDIMPALRLSMAQGATPRIDDINALASRIWQETYGARRGIAWIDLPPNCADYRGAFALAAAAFGIAVEQAGDRPIASSRSPLTRRRTVRPKAFRTLPELCAA